MSQIDKFCQQSTLNDLEVARAEIDETAWLLARTSGDMSLLDQVIKQDEPPPRFPYEPTMALSLIRTWAKQSRKAIVAIREIVEDEFLTYLTSQELNQIFIELNLDLGVEFGNLVFQDVTSLINKAYDKGKAEIIRGKNLPFSLSQVDNVAKTWCAEHHMYWIRGFYSQKLSQKIGEIVSEGLGQGLGRADIGDLLSRTLSSWRGVGVQPQAYWRGLAAHAMNRTRGFAKLQAYVEAEVRYLRAYNPMDERTSSICRQLVPKMQKVPVYRAVTQRNRMMEAASPEDVKRIAPWPREENIVDSSQEDLMAQNVVSPPYHFHCRTELIEA